MLAAVLVLLVVTAVAWLLWAGSRQPEQGSMRAARGSPGPSAGSTATVSPPVRRGEYLSPEDERVFVQMDPAGRINIRFKARGDEWLLTVPKGIVNPRSRQLYRYDMWVFRPRGTGYYDTYQTLTLEPGTHVVLVREPRNQFDSNAVALRRTAGGKTWGYVNKQNAARIAKRLDAGDELVAISLSTKSRGDEGSRPWILVTTPDRLEQLET